MSLELCDRPLSVAAVAHIGDALDHNRSLTRLHLNNASIRNLSLLETSRPVELPPRTQRKGTMQRTIPTVLRTLPHVTHLASSRSPRAQ